MTLDRAFDIIAEEFRTGIILYLETHKELLTDPDFNCTYKIFRDMIARQRFGNVGVDMIGSVYAKYIDNLLENVTAAEIVKYKNDVFRVVEVIKRNNIKESYNNLFDDYFKA